MSRVLDFDDEQKEFLKHIVSDFGGPCMTLVLLNIIEEILGEAKPDWESDPSSFSEELRKKIEVCQVALEHHDVQSLANKK